MKQQFLTLAVAVPMLVMGQCASSLAKDRTITGTIRGFECGDNCYLTILDSKKAEQVGLCAAPECKDWNEKAAMPLRFKGKRVTVIVGTGQQLDGSGIVMGEMVAFKKVRFLD